MRSGFLFFCPAWALRVTEKRGGLPLQEHSVSTHAPTFARQDGGKGNELHTTAGECGAFLGCFPWVSGLPAPLGWHTALVSQRWTSPALLLSSLSRSLHPNTSEPTQLCWYIHFLSLFLAWALSLLAPHCFYLSGVCGLCMTATFFLFVSPSFLSPFACASVLLNLSLHAHFFPLFGGPGWAVQNEQFRWNQRWFKERVNPVRPVWLEDSARISSKYAISVKLQVLSFKTDCRTAQVLFET